MRRLTWSPTRPPVSFRYGQRDSGDFPGTWQHTRATSKADGSRLTRHVYTESPAGLRITAAVRKFEGFDALDWVVELENLGTADTPILQDILPLDTTFAISPGENAYLHYAKDAIAEWKSLREFFLGDFHLLLPLTASSHDWCAYQLHRPDMDAGFALFFRRHRSPFETMEVRLKGVKPRARYKVSLASTFKARPPRSISGSKLARMTVRIPEKPGSMLLRYSRGR